jgi:hypothetical protein
VKIIIKLCLIKYTVLWNLFYHFIHRTIFFYVGDTMPFLIMLLTLPLICIAQEKRNEPERFFSIKLLLLWLLCQLYVSINNVVRLPLGLIICLILVYNEKLNRPSKFIAFSVGTISFTSSVLVYFLVKTSI